MDQQSVLVIAIVFPLGIVLLALGGYMYDQLQKSIPPEDEKNSIFSAHEKLFKVFYLSPFIYVKRSIQKKDIKGIIIGILFFSGLLFAMIWGNLAIKK